MATECRPPLIAECYANVECRLRDTRMIQTYGLFIWRSVNAHVSLSPKRPPRFRSARASQQRTRSLPPPPRARWPGPSFRAAAGRDARARARASQPASILPARENDG